MKVVNGVIIPCKEMMEHLQEGGYGVYVAISRNNKKGYRTATDIDGDTAGALESIALIAKQVFENYEDAEAAIRDGGKLTRYIQSVVAKRCAELEPPKLNAISAIQFTETEKLVEVENEKSL